MVQAVEKSSPSEAGRSPCCLLLFSKPAEPGYVKTRLIGRLSPDQAAKLHAAFLGDLLQRLVQGDFDLQVAWAQDSGTKPPDVGLATMVQEGEQLGDRLYSALSKVSLNYPYVAAVGSDHPELPLARVREAFDKLKAGTDVVVGPAHDGGYYLIALRRAAIDRALFDGVKWSSASVLRSTLERCKSLGLVTEELEPAFDVDEPEDLDRLASSLAVDDSIDCPRTRTLLASWEIGGDARGEEG